MATMDFDRLSEHKRRHPGWMLLNAHTSPFIIAFFHHVFLNERRSGIVHGVMVEKLNQFLDHAREVLGDDEEYSGSATFYLNSWSSNERGFLRKYYDEHGNEVYDLTSSAESAIAWLESTMRTGAISTESRMRVMIDLVTQMIIKTDVDPSRRLKDLYQRRNEIDAEIKAIESGNAPVMSRHELADMFAYFIESARGMMSDFRGVADSFRLHEKRTREKIVDWHGTKNALLTSIFEDDISIENSNEGRSFDGYMRLINSPSRMDEFEGMLHELQKLDIVKEQGVDGLLRDLAFNLRREGHNVWRVQGNVNKHLLGQVRPQVLDQHKRIGDLIRAIESTVNKLKEDYPKGVVVEIDEMHPRLTLPMNRLLFTPPKESRITVGEVEEGLALEDQSSLYLSSSVSLVRLKSAINEALKLSPQVSLKSILDKHPVKLGLPEVLAYLSLANESNAYSTGEPDQVSWERNGVKRTGTMPRLIFIRPFDETTQESA